MATIKVPTKSLHPVVQSMIRQLRGPEIYSRAGGYCGKRRTYRPNEVRVQFHEGAELVLSTSWRTEAVHGDKVEGSEKIEHWTGSDGEGNTSHYAIYRGPVVEVSHGWGSSTRIVTLLHLPTGYAAGSDAFYACLRYYNDAHRRLPAVTFASLLSVAVDAVLEGKPMPYLAEEPAPTLVSFHIRLTLSNGAIYTTATAAEDIAQAQARFLESNTIPFLRAEISGADEHWVVVSGNTPDPDGDQGAAMEHLISSL